MTAGLRIRERVAEIVALEFEGLELLRNRCYGGGRSYTTRRRLF
jgi:hypothetical protein